MCSRHNILEIIDVTEEFEVDWGLDKVRNEAQGTADDFGFSVFDFGLRGKRGRSPGPLGRGADAIGSERKNEFRQA